MKWPQNIFLFQLFFINFTILSKFNFVNLADSKMFYDHICREWGLKSEEIRGYKASITPSTKTSDWEAEEERRKRDFEKLPEFQPEISDKLKQKFRFGIPNGQRRKWWLVATGGLQLLTEVGDVWSAAERSSANVPVSDVSSFGGGVDLLSILCPTVAGKCKHFLHVVWTRNKHIEFSPLIPTVAVILLMYMEPPLAYLSIQSMINRSVKDSWYFTLTRDQFLASVEALREIIHRKNGKIEEKCASLGLDLAQIGLALFPVFFLPFTPLPVALTLFDSYASEGRKILVRFAICLFQMEERSLLSSTTPREFLMNLVRGMDKLSGVQSTRNFLIHSFDIFLSRGRHITKYEDSAIRERKGVFSQGSIRGASSFTDMISPDISEVLSTPRRNSFSPEDYEADDIPIDGDSSLSLKVLQRFTPEELEAEQKKLQKQIADSSAPKVIGGRLLTPQLFYNLRSFIPISIRSYCAKKVFALSEDGTSMISLHQKCTRKVHYIIMIKTNKQTIGAFLGDPINPEMCVKGRYYGKPYAFVFTSDPLTIFRKEKPENVLFQSTTKTSFSIGGPRPAIHIEEGFSVLNSERCDTFGSPSFTECPNGDPILDVEIYQLVVPQYVYD